MTRNQPYLFFTIDVEEWFNSTKLIREDLGENYKKTSDIAENLLFLIEMLEKAGIKGTFFFLKDIADQYPSIVRKIINRGHEIALHGETHEHLAKISSNDFQLMIKRMKEYFLKNFQIIIHGYRAPYFSIHPKAISLLKDAGFCYDSSIVPSLPIPGWYGIPRAPLYPYKIGNKLDGNDGQTKFLEFPLSVHPRFRLPGAGGYYFRNLGIHFTLRVLRQCLIKNGYAMFYIHPWELSANIPKTARLPFYMRRRTGLWTRNNLQFLLKEIKHSFPSVNNSTLYDYYISNQI